VTVRTVGLVGGGTMGQGIAITSASAGLDVLLLEKSPELARGSVDEIGEALDYLKVQIFQRLDQVCPPEDILATNSSSLSVTEIATRTRRPDRVVGLHFLQPVPTVPLVEVVRGLGTSDQTFRASMEFVRLLGKTGIEVLSSSLRGT